MFKSTISLLFYLSCDLVSYQETNGLVNYWGLFSATLYIIITVGIAIIAIIVIYFSIFLLQTWNTLINVDFVQHIMIISVLLRFSACSPLWYIAHFCYFCRNWVNNVTEALHAPWVNHHPLALCPSGGFSLQKYFTVSYS